MSELNFTEAQKDAIYAKGGSIIVSAAAGSGKTRVLVQRVIERLTDKENPAEADRLLIVTFTNAAAAEMKSRIIAALEEKIAEDPQNENLRRQRRILPNADICTIHSFCSRVIRNNFYQLNIGRDFRIASEGEVRVLKESVLSELLDEYYAKNDGEFLAFTENVSNEKNDNAVSAVIFSLYDYIMSHPFPEQWVNSAVDRYQSELPLSKTIYGQAALRPLSKELDFINSLLVQYKNQAHEICILDEKSEEKFLSTLQTVYNLSEKIRSLSERLCFDSCPAWDSIAEELQSLQKIVIKQPSKPREKKGDETNARVREGFERLKAIKDFIDKFLESKTQKIFSISEEQYRQDNQKLLPVLNGMKKLLLDFMKRYKEEKRKKNIVDFADLEHLLLRLLVKPSNNEIGYERTIFAKQLSEQYDEIMVDEYQDSNNAQEMIFNALSKNNENCFVVGDVKQSIYRFREAMPENFIRRRNNSTLYSRETPLFPARIILDRNFRSRKGITDSVNFVFEQLMSKDMGEIDYNEEEKLVAAASYPQADFPDAELHIVLNSTADSEEEESNYQAEGRYIANLIENMIQTATVTENGIQRPARYSDFCILMRNMSSHAADYAEQFEKAGIPTFINKGVGLFSCYEVRVAIAFLRVLDNPLQDIPLLSVLMHPIFGFSADDMAYIRSECPHKYIYASISNFHKTFCTSKTDFLFELAQHCKQFLDEFEFYRRLAVTLPTDKLLSIFFERSGFISFVSAMKGGNGRIKNLYRFLTCAREYEGESFKGLTGFVRLINRLEETGNDMTASDTAPPDSVKIMSIHHSKGLEFPICILAATNSKGNNRTESIVRHADLGIGLMTADTEYMFKSTTLQRNIILETLHHEEMSEELRILYVAMTRAKERLIMVTSFQGEFYDENNSFRKRLSSLALLLLGNDKKISPIAVEQASNLSDWILMCALRHPSMADLRILSGYSEITEAKTDSVWQLVISEAHPQLSESEGETPQIQVPIDTTLLSLLKERLSYKYPKYERTQIPSKVTASDIAHSKNRIHYAAAKRPNFMQEKKLSGSERGTALHLFMQYANFDYAKQDLENEVSRLKQKNILSEEQCQTLDRKHICRFLESSLYQRISTSNFVRREYQFTAYIRASEIIENLTDGADEDVVLQGAIDCLFEENGNIVIIDYKTDRIKEISELQRRYAIQLFLYKRAVEQTLNRKVSECILYSLHLGEEISLDCT